MSQNCCRLGPRLCGWKASAGVPCLPFAYMALPGGVPLMAMRAPSFCTMAKSLAALPGLGPYTVGAVRSIAFQQPAPLVDGNEIMAGLSDGFLVALSVNVNKVATVRNSRGGHTPSVIEAVRTCIDAGAPGITVHPRADARHITPDDVREIAEELAPLKGRVEYNIEGDPRPGFLELVLSVAPDQCTLVPVKPGEITSLADTIRSFEEIADGKWDHLPEQAFMYVGPIEQAEEQARKMAAKV